MLEIASKSIPTQNATAPMSMENIDSDYGDDNAEALHRLREDYDVLDPRPWIMSVLHGKLSVIASMHAPACGWIITGPWGRHSRTSQISS
jgi:hypothetical protein